jgi:hypothetical protein
MDEGFNPIPNVSVKLSPENKRALPLDTSTDQNGVFLFSGLVSGDYTVTVNYLGFLPVAITNVHIVDAQDVRLRRILLETGEAYGNCTVRISPMSEVQHTGAHDVEISGRVRVRRGEIAAVTLVMFTDNEAIQRSTLSDNRGRFKFVAAAAGDVRLMIDIEEKSGRILIPQQQANVRWADLGDRIAIPGITLNRSGLGHCCY